MPPEKHALLSALSSERWLHCPPSARLNELYEDQGSSFAAEGTDAHALCEFKLKKALGMEIEDPTEDLTYYNSEMEECAEGYAGFVLEQLQEAREHCTDPTVLIEQRLDFSKWVPDAFGTGDCLIVADGMLSITDFKYGRGVTVSADHNPQLMLYALGALDLFDCLYDIKEVRMSIYQPRLANVSSCVMSAEELTAWAENELKPAAEKAFIGEGEYHCGEWCRFCKARFECRERAEANLSLTKYEFKDPPLLSTEEIAEILTRADRLCSWAEDVKDFAYREALAGRKWPGYKLVEGRSVRKYADERAVAATVTAKGYDPYEKKLLGITEMQKMLGKARFEELLGEYIIKPTGKPVLVPASDKRREIEITDAKNDFNEFTEE